MLPPSRAQAGDAPIRGTDNDAAVARLSAVQKGYLNDPYIRYLVPRAHLLPPRPPLINIGTYIRSAGIDALVNQWLQIAGNAGQKCQVAGPLKDALQTYFEVDFPEITTKKAMSIRKSKDLMAGLGDPAGVSLDRGGTALHAGKYHLLPSDLRLEPSQSLGRLLFSAPDAEQNAILDPSLPTLLLFECVLAYMSPSQSAQLLEWFVTTFKESQNSVLGCIIYEMFGLNDSFGRVMVNNLRERNITIPGAESFQTIESLSKRYLDAGFSAAFALTLKEIRKTYIEEDELERISKLEFLDETEELDLVLAHYYISWGLYLGSSDLGTIWGNWGLTRKRDL
ncbi:hypothetical protein CVT26_015433 [Gymnopilus dilepis]|uniref:Leucine carboxyl methyltransferase 1 n=1 Tax=Gymnopilus dilepis TaxID=231916 RepID=A0A409WM99_9AGAR|nr:hypothetical protein CVT26_015433 [Gymnopilus dilepis]